MRSSILDKFEMVSYKSAIMKLMRTKLSQTNIATKAQLYIPTVRTIITPQKAVEVSEEELQELLSIVTAFPNGLYYTEGEIGFWSASPLIYDATMARDSRIMMTGIQRSFLREMLDSFTQPIGMASTFDRDLLRQAGDVMGRESRAFANCRALWSVHIPSDVKFIAEDAFEGSPEFCIWTESRDSVPARFAEEHNIVLFIYEEMEGSNG